MVRKLAVMGWVLIRRISGSTRGVFSDALSSGVRRGASGSSESAASVLIMATAVGVSTMARVATTVPYVYSTCS